MFSGNISMYPLQSGKSFRMFLKLCRHISRTYPIPSGNSSGCVEYIPHGNSSRIYPIPSAKSSMLYSMPSGNSSSSVLLHLIWVLSTTPSTSSVMYPLPLSNISFLMDSFPSGTSSKMHPIPLGNNSRIYPLPSGNSSGMYPVPSGNSSEMHPIPLGNNSRIYPLPSGNSSVMYPVHSGNSSRMYQISSGNSLGCIEYYLAKSRHKQMYPTKQTIPVRDCGRKKLSNLKKKFLSHGQGYLRPDPTILQC
jgi:hypothetical protein